jgi:putative oxidoreductase
MTKFHPWAELAARLLLAALFIAAGVSKISGYEATAGYMQAMGVPAGLLPLVIALEIVGGLAIAVGYRTRLAAFLLAGFTVLAALLFHNPVADPSEQVQFLKTLAVAGGFLMLVVYGAGRISVDERRA